MRIEKRRITGPGNLRCDRSGGCVHHAAGRHGGNHVINFVNIAPAVYTVSDSGQGTYSGQATYVHADGMQTVVPSAIDSATTASPRTRSIWDPWRPGLPGALRNRTATRKFRHGNCERHVRARGLLRCPVDQSGPRSGQPTPPAHQFGRCGAGKYRHGGRPGGEHGDRSHPAIGTGRQSRGSACGKRDDWSTWSLPEVEETKATAIRELLRVRGPCIILMLASDEMEDTAIELTNRITVIRGDLQRRERYLNISVAGLPTVAL